jgi:hypothetical protein
MPMEEIHTREMRVKGLPEQKPMAMKEEESFKKKMKKSEKQ